LLFDSAEDAQAALQVLSSVGREHTYALMSGPPLRSVGTVVVSDGVFAESVTTKGE